MTSPSGVFADRPRTAPVMPQTHITEPDDFEPLTVGKVILCAFHSIRVGVPSSV